MAQEDGARDHRLLKRLVAGRKVALDEEPEAQGICRTLAVDVRVGLGSVARPERLVRPPLHDRSLAQVEHAKGGVHVVQLQHVAPEPAVLQIKARVL